ncbi:phosphoglycerate mutase family protein [Stagonosporopsis vannaccii]|nr:phosphoglycerate mutase family protein [Stagonosporopsis vannaccii]
MAPRAVHAQCKHVFTIFPYFVRIDLEATKKPANTPSALTQLKQEFGDRVDWRRCMDVYVDYDSNAGTFAPNAKSLRDRGLELCRFLLDRDEKEIVVVLHIDFLHYVTGDLHEDGSQAKGN